MSREKGFSLIELLIVVAIILIIAAIAIPNLLRSRMAANEASAVSGIRAISTAENSYNSVYPAVGYACTLSNLGPPASGQASSTAADLLDPVISNGTKSGYSFSLINCTGSSPASFYNSTAVPITVGGTGQRAFCSNPSGIIQYAQDGVAADCIAGTAVLQ